MNRPFKTLSTTALAAVLAASALVPAASAAPTTQAVSSLDSVIVSLNGENVKISLEDYANLLELGKIQAASVKYVQTANGNNYTLADYSDYLDLTKNVNEAAGELEDKGNKQTVSNLKEGTIVNGEIVVSPVTEDFEVTDIAAINETSVTVTLKDTPSESPKNGDFNVTVGGEEVAVTGVTEGTAANTYVLATDLDGKEGQLTINGVTADKAVDFVAPSIVETVAQSATVFDVKYSEKVTKATAENVANYTLRYAVGQATTYTLHATSAAAGQVQATAVLLEDGQTVRVTIVNVDANDTAFDNKGLIADANYQVKVSTNVKDLADNSAVTTYGPTFKGTNVADSTPAKVLAGNYNSTTGNLSFTFDKAVPQGKVDLTKVTLTAPGKDAVSLAGLSLVVSGNELTVDASSLADSVSALGNNIKVEYTAGAFEDVNGNTLPAGSKQLTVTEGLKISSSAYNEESNVLTLNFTDQVDIAKLADDLSAITVSGKSLPNAGVNLINTSNSNVIKLQLPAEYTTTTGAVVKTLEDAARTNVSKTDGVVVEVPDAIFTAVGETAGMTTAAGKTTLKNIEYTRDETAPAVSSVQIEGLAPTAGTLTVKFDEKIDVSSLKPADLAFYDTEDTALATALTDLTGVTLLADQTPGTNNTATYSDTFTVDLSSGAPGNTVAAALNTAINTDKKDVVLANKAKAFADVNAVEATAGTTAVSTVGANAGVTDITSYTTTAVGTKVVTIQVKNSSAVIPLDKATAETKGNYSIVPTNGGAAVPVQKSVLSADAKTITLYLAEATTAGKGYTVTAQNVKNQTGSLLVDTVPSPDTTGKFVTTFTGAAVSTTATLTPDLTTTDVDNDGTFSAGDKITLDFKEPITLDSTAKSTDFTVVQGTGSNSTPSLGSNATVKQEGTKVVITLGAGADLEKDNTIALQTGNSKIKNYDGAKVDFTAKAVVNPVIDAPTIKTAVYSDANDNGALDAGDEVKVTFTSKVIDNTVATINDDFVLDATSATYTVALAEDGMSAVLTFVDPKTFKPGDTTITVNSTANNVNLVGPWGDKLENTTTAIKVAKSDAVKPEVQSATYDASKGIIALKMSEKVNANSNFADNFTVADGVIAGTNTVKVDSADPTLVIIKLATPTDFIESGVTKVKVKASNALAIKDANGNQVKYTGTDILVNSGTVDVVVTPSVIYNVSNLTNFNSAVVNAENGDTINVDLTGFNADPIKLVEPLGKTLTVNLTGATNNNVEVDMSGATVNNNATGTFTITDVSGNTWNENVSHNTIVFNDPDAGTNFVIGAGQTVTSLTLNTPATVTVPSGAAVTTLTVEAGAAKTTIANAGTIATLTSKAPEVVLTGEGVITTPVTEGDGTLVDDKGEAAFSNEEIDDAAVNAKKADNEFLNSLYATRNAAESAIKALATKETLATTDIEWDGARATVTLNTGKAEFIFTDITEVKTEEIQAKKNADDVAIKEKQATPGDFLTKTYETKMLAEEAIKALATNGTLASTTISWTESAATVTLNDATTVEFVFTDVTEVKTTEAEGALTAFLKTAIEFTYSDKDPAGGNYKLLSELKVEGNVVTADVLADTEAITAISEKAGIIEKHTADQTGKDLMSYSTDVYVMNTLSRYLGALNAQSGVEIKEIKFKDETYTWVAPTDLKGSNWKDLQNESKTLVSAIVDSTGELRSVRDINFTIFDANGYSIDVNFVANAPKTTMIDAE